MWILFIGLRVLVLVSLFLILGYVFGNFSRNATLSRMTKVGAVFLVIALIGANVAFFRFSAWRLNNFQHNERLEFCPSPRDTTTHMH